jgi:capsular polysaccharide biosynthesis protein
MQLLRKLPVNFVAADNHLFAHELSIEACLPNLVTARFIHADLYWYSAAKGLSSLKQAQLLYKKMNWRRLFSPKIRYCAKTALVFDAWSANYFHWMTEAVPKLQYLAATGERLVVYVPTPIFQQPFAKFTLSLFKNLTFKELSVTDITKYLIKEAYLCDLQMQTGNYHPITVKAAASLLNASVELQYPSSKRIFLYRNVSEGRGILNFDQIKPILDQYEFAIVDPGQLKIEEQIALMRKCEILGGVHGAGLTNMMFLPQGAKILELRRYDDKLNNCYFSLASALGHGYYYQLCDVNDESLPTQRNTFLVNPAAFEKTISTIVNKYV